MSSSARRIRTSPYHWKEHEKEDSAAPAAGSFAHGGKGTKTPFLGGAPSVCSLNRRANPEWPAPLLPGHWALAGRKFGPGVSTWSAWPVPCCLAGRRMRADETSAPTERLPYGSRGGCPHPPVRTSPYGCLHQARFFVQPAAAARKRRQSAGPPAPDSRNDFQESVPRNGGPGAGDWSAGTPRSPAPGAFLVPFWANKKEHSPKRIPPPGKCPRFWLSPFFQNGKLKGAADSA